MPAATTTSSIPSPRPDYYALAGIFRSTQTLVHENALSRVKRPLPVDAERARPSLQFPGLRANEEEIESLKLAVKFRGGIFAAGINH
ncbi:MAG: hypothetical protein U0992_06265 [Planctomycetaceae bacterium]